MPAALICDARAPRAAWRWRDWIWRNVTRLLARVVIVLVAGEPRAFIRSRFPHVSPVGGEFRVRADVECRVERRGASGIACNRDWSRNRSLVTRKPAGAASPCSFDRAFRSINQRTHRSAPLGRPDRPRARKRPSDRTRYLIVALWFSEHSRLPSRWRHAYARGRRTPRSWRVIGVSAGRRRGGLRAEHREWRPSRRVSPCYLLEFSFECRTKCLASRAIAYRRFPKRSLPPWERVSGAADGETAPGWEEGVIDWWVLFFYSWIKFTLTWRPWPVFAATDISRDNKSAPRKFWPSWPFEKGSEIKFDNLYFRFLYFWYSEYLCRGESQGQFPLSFLISRASELWNSNLFL